MKRPIGPPADLATWPDVSPDEAPPGRRVRYFDDDPHAMGLILAAVTALRVGIEARRDRARAGSEAYHALGSLAGRLTVIEAQCRRALPGAAEAAANADLAAAERAAQLDAYARRRRH